MPHKNYPPSILLDYLQEIANNQSGVREAADIEYVHETRVALRRLRNALSVFRDFLSSPQLGRWRRDIRLMDEDFGMARDLDVKLAFVESLQKKTGAPVKELEGIISGLREERRAVQKDIIRLLDRLQRRHTLSALKKFLESRPEKISKDDLRKLQKTCRKKIRKKVKNILIYEPYVSQPDKSFELHRLRIAVRKLRYTLEEASAIFHGKLKKFIPAVLNIQEWLGDVHDMDVWLRQKAMPPYVIKICSRRRLIAYQKFIKHWNRIRRDKFWEELLCV